MLVLLFLPIKLKMKFSNLNVDPMTHVGKDSGHVTCQGSSFTGDWVGRAHTSSLVKDVHPQWKGLEGVLTEDQMLCATSQSVPYRRKDSSHA